MTQLDILFDAPSVRATLTREDAKRGRELGHEGAKLVADNAGDAWKRQALAAFFAYGSEHGPFFTTEDVRTASEVPAPHDARAWGQVALEAKRRGWIKWAGYAPAKDRKSHWCPGNVWQWTGE